MKIVEVNAIYGTKSTGTIIVGIGTEFEKEGHTVYYATPNAPKGERFFSIGNSFDRRCHALLCRIFGKQGYFSRFETYKFLRWLDKINPDVLHLHNLHSNFINLKMLFEYSKKRQIKTIITLHDSWFFTGKCFHFLYDDCQKWQTGCEKCPRKHKEQNSLFFDTAKSVWRDRVEFIGKNLNISIVAVSEWLANTAKKSLLKNLKIYTIHNGIDNGLFSPIKNAKKDLKLPEDKFIILCMANKWFADENKEISKVITQNLSDNDVLLVVGCNETQIASLPKNIVGIPCLSPKELASYYSASDVFLNITKVDSFPTVNIEALSCGVPVVTFDSGGSKECIVEGVHGYAVPYGDTTALWDAVSKVKTNGKAFYSRNCRNHAVKNFNKIECFKKYLDLL